MLGGPSWSPEGAGAESLPQVERWIQTQARSTGSKLWWEGQEAATGAPPSHLKYLRQSPG